MTSQLMIRIDDELKNRATRFARAEGKSLSEVVRDLLREYSRDRDMGAHIDHLWNAIREELPDEAADPDWVQQVIHEVRAERRSRR